MKAIPKFDVTKQGNFAIWESGCWLPRNQGGFSILVAGPNGEKLPVIFDRTSGIHRYLLPVTLGCMYVGVTVDKQDEENYYLRVTLKKIDKLVRDSTSGKAEMASMDGQVMFDLTTVCNKEQLDNVEVPGFKDFVQAAISKATTEQEEQTLFWGVPRVREQ